jgi:hypothetical protein
MKIQYGGRERSEMVVEVGGGKKWIFFLLLPKTLPFPPINFQLETSRRGDKAKEENEIYLDRINYVFFSPSFASVFRRFFVACFD